MIEWVGIHLLLTCSPIPRVFSLQMNAITLDTKTPGSHPYTQTPTHPQPPTPPPPTHTHTNTRTQTHAHKQRTQTHAHTHNVPGAISMPLALCIQVWTGALCWTWWCSCVTCLRPLSSAAIPTSTPLVSHDHISYPNSIGLRPFPLLPPPSSPPTSFLLPLPLLSSCFPFHRCHGYRGLSTGQSARSN